MNRRSFFQLITGAVAGVYASCVSQAKGLTKTKEWHHIAKTSDGLYIDGVLQKRSGTKFVCYGCCNCREQKLMEVNGRIMVLCPNHPPYFVNGDGTKESVFYYPRAIDIREQRCKNSTELYWIKPKELPISFFKT
jgi:hypothetical protein